MCDVCGDKGIVRLNWPDAEHEFALCLCATGRWFRSNVDGQDRRIETFGWQVWAAREQVDPRLIVRLEDALTAEEMAILGFSKPVAQLNREAALLAVGRTKKQPRL